MKKFRKLNQYLAQLENEQHSYFDEFAPVDEFMYANAAAPAASACVASVQQSRPYIITLTNTNTGATKTAKLFGAYVNLYATNYGSDVGITYSVSSKFTYAALLLQSMTNAFMAHSWRFDSTDTTQLQQTMYITYTNVADGRTATEPVDLGVKNNLYANQNTGLEFTFDVKIDGNTGLEIDILAGKSLRVTIYPITVNDSTQAFNGRSIAKKYVQPQISAMPTIAANVQGSY